MWIRTVYWKFRFFCCYMGNVITGASAEYEIRFIKKYKSRPNDDVIDWAHNVAWKISKARADYSCAELSSDFEGCMVDVYDVRYSEMMV